MLTFINTHRMSHLHEYSFLYSVHKKHDNLLSTMLLVPFVTNFSAFFALLEAIANFKELSRIVISIQFSV